jgi:hypothetical protein
VAADGLLGLAAVVDDDKLQQLMTSWGVSVGNRSIDLSSHSGTKPSNPSTSSLTTLWRQLQFLQQPAWPAKRCIL